MTEEAIENLELLTGLADDYEANFVYSYIGNKDKKLHIVKFNCSELSTKQKETDTDLEKATERLLERVRDAMV